MHLFRFLTPGFPLRATLCVGMAAGFIAPPAPAQTADPTATPPAASSAPVAKPGTYAVSGGNLTAAPGLQVPNGNLPWALDTTADGKPALVPVHHSAIEEPPGAASAPPSNYTLQGTRARTVVRTTTPTFFIHASDRTENTGDAGHGNPTGWVLERAPASGGNRTLPNVQYADIAQGTSCAAPTLCLSAETLPDGWVRLSPKQPLDRGEYVLMPVQRQPNPEAVVVYDFACDPSAPIARDAVIAGAPQTAKHKH